MEFIFDNFMDATKLAKTLAINGKRPIIKKSSDHFVVCIEHELLKEEIKNLTVTGLITQKSNTKLSFEVGQESEPQESVQQEHTRLKAQLERILLKEKIEVERLESKRLENERLKNEQHERDRPERERLEQLKHFERLKHEQERLVREQERVAREQTEREDTKKLLALSKKNVELYRSQQKQTQRKLKIEQRDLPRLVRQRQNHEQLEIEKKSRERFAAERIEREKPERLELNKYIINTIINEGNLSILNVSTSKDFYVLVLFDPSIQNNNIDFFLLYYAYGKNLVSRTKESVYKSHDLINIDINCSNFIYDQYQIWVNLNPKTAQEKLSSQLTHESPPNPRIKCSKCDGNAHVYWSEGNAAAWQGANERVNHHDICSYCKGAGYIDNVFN